MTPGVRTAAVSTWRGVEQVMGMPVSVVLRGRQARTAAGLAAWDAVVSELRAVDRIFSTYRPDSVVNQLDRGERVVADCPPEVAEVLALADAAHEQSGGAFSVRLPLDRDDRSTRRRLDPSGVVKGWAAERAARHLAALEETDFCLSAGGDIVGRAAPGRSPWSIGIEDPLCPDKVMATVAISDGGVATSGTARRGAHLVDARTGHAPEGIVSVTVIGPSLTWADIDATAAFAQGRAAAAWLRTRPIRSALVVTTDGRREVVVPTVGSLP